jgi:hypothetical protein
VDWRRAGRISGKTFSLALRPILPSVSAVIGIMRFVGVMNAALWFGGSVFFTFAVAPAFFTPQMVGLFGEAYPGIIAQWVWERYYLLQYWCGSIAVLHLLAEWVYLGRAIHRVTLSALITAFCLGMIGGLWLHPKLKGLHQVKHSRPGVYTTIRQNQASRSYAVWGGVAAGLNWLMLGALLVYTARVTHPLSGPRFVPASKFRS